MQVIKSDIIDGVLLIQPDVYYDFRGEYIKTYDSVEYHFRDKEQEIRFVEDDISVSSRNVLRGLHGDDRTCKLVQCFFEFSTTDDPSDSIRIEQSREGASEIVHVFLKQLGESE